MYVLDHDEQGAVGVIVNRPTDEPLDEGLEQWEAYLSSPAVVFEGGPVEDTALIALAETNAPLADNDEYLSPITATIASADLTADPALVAAGVRGVRVFRGYAGWGPGQLEGEIEAGASLVLDSEPGDVFSNEPDEFGEGRCCLRVKLAGRWTPLPAA